MMLDALFTAIGYGLCHQLPERSFFSGGYQLPVCARDTGLYLGFIAALAALWLLHRGEKPTVPPRWPILVLLGLFIASMAFDGVTSYAGLRETTNTLRLITGLLTGWALATIVVPMLNAQLWADAGEGRLLAGGRRVAGWLGALVATYGLVAYLLPQTGLVYPLISVAAILVTFTCVNLVLVCLIGPLERRARRLRDATLQIALAFGLTLLELGAAAWLRVVTERLLA
jgi:uncharacterized membrane protein